MSLAYTDFLRALIHILEAKKMYFPRWVYCVMILIMYCQFAGYVFCTYESKPLFDPKIVFFAHWNEYSPGTFLLFVSANDSLTLLFFWFFQGMLYCYILYIVIQTLLDHYDSKLKVQYQAFFKVLNTFYQFFFSSFLWVFYVPFTEIHSGILVCWNNSFLVEFRTDSCSKKPMYFFILGAAGLILTFFTGVVLVYFYVSYQFLERNYLKRRFQPNQILQLVARSLLIFLYYLDINNIFVVKHIVSHLLGLTSCYDFMRHLPFRDKFICLFYGCSTLIYEFSMILFTLWEMTNLLEEFNIFFVWTMGSSFLVAFTIIYVNYYYFQATLLLPGSLTECSIRSLDVLLEELMSLALRSEYDKAAKLQIQGVLQRMEKKLPTHLNFFKKKTDLKIILSENQQINTLKIVKIINELFCVFLKDPKVFACKTIYEFISLKYCSFLGVYQDNPIKAYYELKTLLSMNSQRGGASSRYKPSVIFIIISQVITQNIQDLLIETFKIKFEMEITLNSKNQDNSELVWKTLPKSEEYKLNFISKMSEIVKCKLKFWENLCLGYNKMNDFLLDSLSLMRKIEKFSYDLKSSLTEGNLPGLSNNVIYLKLMALNYLMIQNDNIKAKLFEEKLKEIKKSDAGLKEGCVNSFSILSGNSIVIQISLLREKGRIVNKKTERMAAFFGYSLHEFQGITSVNSLMPETLAATHALFLARFIKKGPSLHFKQGKNVYGRMNEGYVFPLKLDLNLTFVQSEDFVISGVLTKSMETNLAFIFNEKGDILGISNSLAREIPGGLTRKAISSIYEVYKIFWMMPDLLDQLPSPETLRKLVEKKENLSLLTVNGRVSIYFPKELEHVLDILVRYRSKHEGILSSIQSYSDLFLKENKPFLKKFCSSFKAFLQKRLARYSLRNEIYFISGKKCVSFFILTIHELYNIDTAQELDYLSYSIDKTNTTQNSQYTYISLRSEKNGQTMLGSLLEKKEVVEKKEGVEEARASHVLEIKHFRNENLRMENLPQEEGRGMFTLPEKIDIMKMNNDLQTSPPIVDLISPDVIKMPPVKLMEDDEKSDKNEDKMSIEGKNAESNEAEATAKDMRESSIRSSASVNLNNKGLAFIAEFIKHGKITILLRKIFSILFFQIATFLFIDIIYIILIKSKFDGYNSNAGSTTTPAILINLYYKSLMSASSFQFYREGLFNQSEIELSLDGLRDLISTSYSGIDESLSNAALFTNDVYNGHIPVEFSESMLITKQSETQSLPFVVFAQHLQSLIFTLLNDSANQGYYIQLRGNYAPFTKKILKISEDLLRNLEDDKNSFITFYIYLTVTGVVSSFVLQFLSFPFYKKYYNYLERVLLLVTRLQERECDDELLKLKRFLSFLDSKNENYLVASIAKFEGEKTRNHVLEKKTKKPEDVNGKDYKRRMKAAKKSNYLTSRINNHQINMNSFRTVFFLSIFLVAGYYTGASLFLIEINRTLNYANDIMGFCNMFFLNANTISLSKRFVIGWNFLPDKNYINQTEIEDLKAILNNSMVVLQQTLDKRIEIPNGEVPEEILKALREVLNDDSCNYDENRNDCQGLDLNYFHYGLRQFTQNLLNKLELEKSELMKWGQANQQTTRKYLLEDQSLLINLLNYRIMEQTLSKLEEITINANKTLINQLYNNLFMLFVLGGILCSVAWGLFAIIRMKVMTSEINLSKKLLIMIPINKLNEESTVHLLRNLDNV